MGTLENWLPMRLGGITRRSGFRFVTEVKNSNLTTRLIPFEFNTLQTYMLEFGQKQDSSRPITTADTTDNFFIIAGNHTFAFQGTRTFTVTGSTGNNSTYTVISSEIDGTPDTTIYVNETVADNTADGDITATVGYIRFYRDEGQLESAPGVPTEVRSPYDAGDLSNVKYVQSNDVMFFTHPDYEPHELTRSAAADNLDATWTMSKMAPTDGPYLDENTTTTTLTFTSGAVGSDTLTASAALFATSDIGRSVRMRDEDESSDIGWAKITNYTSTTVVTVSVKVAVTDEAETTWSIGAWSHTTGWPATATFFGGRLWFAATAAEPNTLWATRLGSFRSFRPTARNATGTVRYHDGITAQIDSPQLNAIRWMLPDQQGLIVMTDGGVHAVVETGDQLGPADITGANTPTFGFKARRQNDDTVSALVSPRAAGKIILQLEKGDRRLLQELFTFADDKFIGTDLTVLAEHINVGGIVESALQVRPETRLWLVRSDGQLTQMTLDIEQQVVAWGRHIVGGSAAGQDNAVVESIATIRKSNEDQLWAVVRRTINGQTKRYVEFMEEAFDVNTDNESAFFVDSGLTLNDNKTVTGASQTSPITITAVAHGFSNSDVVRIRNVTGMTEINDRSFTIGSVETDTFALLDEDGAEVDDDGNLTHGAYVSGGDANKEETTITGLDHLEGEVVNVMVDGATHPPQRVTSGLIILRSGASLVHIGLPVSSLMTTMPITATTGTDDSRPGIISVAQVLLQVDRSMGGKVGTSDGDFNEIIYRTAADTTGEALPLFTGYLESDSF